MTKEKRAHELAPFLEPDESQQGHFDEFAKRVWNGAKTEFVIQPFPDSFEESGRGAGGGSDSAFPLVVKASQWDIFG